MKYIELKSSLKNKIEHVYLITGDDRFLCFDALKKIEDTLHISIKDMNSVTITGSETTAKEIVLSANLYPFGDEYRLVTIKNFNPSKNKEDQKILQTYCDSPLQSTVLVFFNPDDSDFIKTLTKIEMIDCNKLDVKSISLFVKNYLAKNEIMSSENSISKLIEYCNYDMTRINNELEKLTAYLDDTKTLTDEIIEQNVVKDKEFQIFQLSEYIARGDSKNAVDLVESFSLKSGMSFSILPLLLSNYRRALFVSINKDKTSSELASLLGVKEFAIKMLKNQISVFNPKQLKQIVDMIGDYDSRVKLGKIKENTAIKTLVFNILNIRGK